jgi:hypothetical protein
VDATLGILIGVVIDCSSVISLMVGSLMDTGSMFKVNGALSTPDPSTSSPIICVNGAFSPFWGAWSLSAHNPPLSTHKLAIKKRICDFDSCQINCIITITESVGKMSVL